jgi:hypothetical protein
MEIEKSIIDVEIENQNLGIATTEPTEVCVIDDDSIEITSAKKEFVITGDDIYISGSGQTTPQWIQDIIDQEVTSKIADKTTGLTDAITSINQSLLELELAKNTYTESIMTEATINGIVVSHLDTLNATVQDNSANIVNLDLVKTTPDEALALSISHLNSQIQDGEIHSLVTDLSTTIANNEQTAAANITSLASVFNGNASSIETILSTQSDEFSSEANAITELRSAIELENGVSGTATAVTRLNTFVGYEEGADTIPDELQALAGSIEDNEAALGALANQVDGEVMIHAENYGPVTILDPVADTQPTYIVDAVDPDLSALNGVYGAFKASLYTTAAAPTSTSTDQYNLKMDLHGLERTGELNGHYTAGTLCVMKIYVDGGLDEFEETEWLLGYVGEPIALPTDKNIIVDFGDVNPGDFVASTVPLPSKEPYASWLAEDALNGDANARSVHTGDSFIYVNTAGQYVRSFKFVKLATPDPLKSDDDGYAWYEIKDSAAMIAATTAHALADGKMKVFYITPTAPYQKGDLWTRNIDGSQQIWECTQDEDVEYNIADWQQVATDDKAVVLLSTGLSGGTVSVDLEASVLSGKSITQYVSDEIDDKTNIYSGKVDPNSPLYEPNNLGSGDIYLWFTTETASEEGSIYDVTKTYSWNGVEWGQIESNSNITNLADLADGKRTIFNNQSHDVPNGVERDLWIPTTGTDDEAYTPGELYQCSTAGAWEIATKYTDDLDTYKLVVNDIIVPGLESQIDNKVEYWFQTNDPKEAWVEEEDRAKHDGDVWYHTADKTSSYYDDGIHGWHAIEDQKALDAIADAADAQAAADGKLTIYRQVLDPATEESEPGVLKNEIHDGDMWLDIDTGEVKIWDISLGSGGDWDNDWETGRTIALAEEITKLDAYLMSAGYTVRLVADTATSEYIYEVFEEDNNGSTKRYSIAKEDSAGITIPEPMVTNGTAYVAGTDWMPTYTVAGGVLAAYDVPGAIGASSSIENTIKTTADKTTAQFAYGSDIIIDGHTYTSGFGLTSEAIRGEGGATPSYDSEFWVNANKLRFTATDGSTAGHDVFSADANGVTFNGKVTFGSGQTGTVEEAVSAIVETTAVGDKNINITDNLIPTDSLVGDINNAGYQLIGNPVKSYAAGADTFAEAQIVIDTNDEVYSPYADEMVKPYYFRYAFKGNNTGVVAEIVDLTTSTNTPITYVLDDGETVNTTEWYIVDGLIHPTGGLVGASGTVKRASDMYKVASVNDVILDTTTTEFSLGWVSGSVDTTISRMKLAIVTADTLTSDLVNADYVANYVASPEVAAAIANDTTTTIGNTITTGYVNALNVHAASIAADSIGVNELNINGALDLSGAQFQWGKSAFPDHGTSGIYMGTHNEQQVFCIGSTTSWIEFDGTTVVLNNVGGNFGQAPGARGEYTVFAEDGEYPSTANGVEYGVIIEVIGGGQGGANFYGSNLQTDGMLGEQTVVSHYNSYGTLIATYASALGTSNARAIWYGWKGYITIGDGHYGQVYSGAVDNVDMVNHGQGGDGFYGYDDYDDDVYLTAGHGGNCGAYAYFDATMNTGDYFTITIGAGGEGAVSVTSIGSGHHALNGADGYASVKIK